MAHSRFSFSIRAILIATGYTAIAVAALVNPSKPWLGVTYGITIALLFYSLLGVIYRTDRGRAFWTGFALFGFGYMAIIFGPFAELSAKLPTTLVLDYALAKFHGPKYPTLPWTSYPAAPATYVPGPVAVDLPVTDSEPSDSSATTEYGASHSGESIELATAGEAESENEPEDAAPTLNPYPLPYTPSPNYSVPVISYSMDGIYHFSAIGQAVFALLFATIGGLIAQFLFALRHAEQTTAASSSMSSDEGP